MTRRRGLLAALGVVLAGLLLFVLWPWFGSGPLAKDTAVPLTLVFQDAKGAESKLNISVPVATTPPGGTAAAGHGHGHKH